MKKIREFLFLMIFLVLPFYGCGDCVDIGGVDVSVPCPDGRADSSSITINASLSGIRPLEEEKQLRIRGERDTDADACYAENAETSFSELVVGNGNVSVNIVNLAHALWSISITALSGGDHDLITIDQVLTPGTNHTLTINSDASGDIVASF